MDDIAFHVNWKDPNRAAGGESANLSSSEAKARAVQCAFDFGSIYATFRQRKVFVRAIVLEREPLVFDAADGKRDRCIRNDPHFAVGELSHHASINSLTH
nr:hypothetical protein [uncultured Nevskia sp.]